MSALARGLLDGARRPRRSTWILLALFLVALVTYINVRPEPIREVDERGRLLGYRAPTREEVVTGTTAPPEGTASTSVPEPEDGERPRGQPPEDGADEPAPEPGADEGEQAPGNDAPATTTTTAPRSTSSTTTTTTAPSTTTTTEPAPAEPDE